MCSQKCLLFICGFFAFSFLMVCPSYVWAQDFSKTFETLQGNLETALESSDDRLSLEPPSNDNSVSVNPLLDSLLEEEAAEAAQEEEKAILDSVLGDSAEKASNSLKPPSGNDQEPQVGEEKELSPLEAFLRDRESAEEKNEEDASSTAQESSNNFGGETTAAQQSNGNSLPVPNGVPRENLGLQAPTGQSQQPSLQAAIKKETPEERQRAIRQEAFSAALNGLFPMRPEEIRQVLKRYDQNLEAIETPIYPLPRPVVNVVTVLLDPGAIPPIINVAAGHVTTLNMIDITSAPWPIQDITWAGNFEIVEPEEGGHVIRITPLSEFAYGNISVRMLGLQTPITFTFRTARDVVHYRLDARIPEYGPYANIPLIEGRPELQAGDKVLAAILEGVPPAGALRLKVSGVDGRTSAYKVNDLTYVRTPLTLLSPGWDASVSSADGMSVFALNSAPVLLLSDEGEFMRARVSEPESELP